MNLKDIQNKKKTYEIVILISGFFAVITFILIATPMYRPATFYIPFLLLIFVGIIIVLSFSYKSLSKEYKEKYVKETIESLIEDGVFDAKKGFSAEEVFQRKIIKKESKFQSEDFMSGKIDGRTFKSSDVKIVRVQSNGKTTTSVTTFLGRFFEIDLDKTYHHPIYIMPNRQSLYRAEKDEKKVDLEYIEFNKTFDVFSRSPQDIFLLLKPRLMEKLLEFSKSHSNVRYALIGKKLFVAIHTGNDTFDLKFLKPIDQSYIQEVKDEIRFMTDIISLLNI